MTPPPSELFLKIHPFWKGSASLTSKCQRILEEMWRGEMIVNMFISLFADTLNSAIHRYHPLSDWLTDIQAFSHSHNISRYHDHVITILILRYQISRTYNRMQMNLEMLRNMQGKDVQEKIRLAGCLATQLGKFLDLFQKKINLYLFLNDIEHLSTSRNLC